MILGGIQHGQFFFEFGDMTLYKDIMQLSFINLY
jgi:hypothetical protein